MKTAIIYFSQTGNTEKVAKAIFSGVKKSRADCTLLPLKEAIKEKISDCDLIGIGTPVFYFQTPFVVVDFLKSLSFMQGKYAFVFCTTGGLTANTLVQMAKILQKQGLYVLGNLRILGYDTFQPYKDKDYAKGHPNSMDLLKSEYFGEEMVNLYNKLKQNFDSSALPVFKTKWSFLHYLSLALTRITVNHWLPDVKIDKNKCDKCSLCAEMCPSSNIVMNSYPVFKSRCTRCYYIEKICPRHAMKINWTFIKIILTIGEQIRKIFDKLHLSRSY